MHTEKRQKYKKKEKRRHDEIFTKVGMTKKYGS